MDDQSKNSNRHLMWWKTASKGTTLGTEMPMLFSWIHPDDQKERSRYLADLTSNTDGDQV